MQYLQLSSCFPFAVFRRVFRCTFSSAMSHVVSSGGSCIPNICGKLSVHAPLAASLVSLESESEMYLFDPYKKCIQSNNETILDQGTLLRPA